MIQPFQSPSSFRSQLIHICNVISQLIVMSEARWFQVRRYLLKFEQLVQNSGCKQEGTDGELISEIPSLHNPSLISQMESKEAFWLLIPFPVAGLTFPKGADSGQLRNIFCLEQKSTSMTYGTCQILFRYHLAFEFLFNRISK